MDDSETRKKCDRCKERRAKNHLCQMICGQQTNLDLCDECLQVYVETERFELPIPIMDGSQRCYYCGEPAQLGSMNQGAEYEVRRETFHYTCSRCFDFESKLKLEELEALNGVARDLSPEEQDKAILDKAILDIIRRVDEEVRSRFGK